jgi:uncharacterized delta-60 repeat protein
MRRRRVSVLLVVVLMVAVATMGWACTSHRGSSVEGPVTEAWVARYTGYGGKTACAYAYDLAVDTPGNVYMTGQSHTPETGNDYITVKYDGNGKESWCARYDGPGTSCDSAKAIAVDASGNVYVTGRATVDEPPCEDIFNCDYATVKYGSDGTQLWVALYNGSGDHLDEATAITLDNSGNVYVTGTSSYYASGSIAREYATIKYDDDGNQQWVARYHGPVQGDDRANAVAVDADGCVYVTGFSAGRQYERDEVSYSIWDYATVKYDTDGDQLWAARYSRPDGGYSSAVALALDNSGNVYVTGESQGPEADGSNQDFVTVKYDRAGKELWVACYDGPASKWDWARDIAVDARGNVYVTGCATCASEGNETDYATVKYNTNGNEVWVRRYGSDSMGKDNTSPDGAYAIALDSSGNAYVTGESYYGLTERGWWDQDSVTVKYDTDGNEMWVGRYNGSGSGREATTAIALDAAGNVYVAGHLGGGDKPACLTIKYVPE